VKHAAILIVRVQWRVASTFIRSVVKARGPINLDSSSVLFSNSKASSILYLLDPFFSPKGIIVPISGKYSCSTQFLPIWLRSEAITAKQ